MCNKKILLNKINLFLNFSTIAVLALLFNKPCVHASDVLGDINDNGVVNLEESIYALQVVAGMTPATILDPTRGPQRTAWGTYSFISNVLTLSTTFSTFESSGFDIGTTEIPIGTVSATTLEITSPPITLTRQAGEAGNIVGKWRGVDHHDNDIVIILDSNGSFQLSMKGDMFTKVIDVPTTNPKTIDGDFSDWSTGSASLDLYSSESNCGGTDGRRITSVSVAQDDDYIYVKMAIDGPPDPTFRYKLGNLVHIRIVPPPLDDCGLSSITGGNASSGMSQFGQGSSEDHPIDEGHLVECRINKCLGLNNWHLSGFQVWADQDSVSVCRSKSELALLKFDFSTCP